MSNCFKNKLNDQLLMLALKADLTDEARLELSLEMESRGLTAEDVEDYRQYLSDYDQRRKISQEKKLSEVRKKIEFRRKLSLVVLLIASVLAIYSLLQGNKIDGVGIEIAGVLVVGIYWLQSMVHLFLLRKMANLREH